MFRKHHYLSHSHSSSAQCYVGCINGAPVAFCSIMHYPHPKVKKIKRILRLVVLPEYQGIGVGKRLLDWVAKTYEDKGFKPTIITSHPALVQSLKRNPLWNCYSKGRQIPGKGSMKNLQFSKNRITTSWAYQTPKVSNEKTKR